MIDIQKHTLFTEEFYSFEMPNFEFWKKEINEIIKVEDNKVHNHSTEIEMESNVKARRTAWDTHYRYPSMKNISQEFICMETSAAHPQKIGFTPCAIPPPRSLLTP